MQQGLRVFVVVLFFVALVHAAPAVAPAFKLKWSTAVTPNKSVEWQILSSNMVVTASRGGEVAAVNASSGAKLWANADLNSSYCRGLFRKGRVIFAGAQDRIVSLDAVSGKLIAKATPPVEFYRRYTSFDEVPDVIYEVHDFEPDNVHEIYSINPMTANITRIFTPTKYTDDLWLASPAPFRVLVSSYPILVIDGSGKQMASSSIPHNRISVIGGYLYAHRTDENRGVIITKYRASDLTPVLEFEMIKPQAQWLTLYSMELWKNGSRTVLVVTQGTMERLCVMTSLDIATGKIVMPPTEIEDAFGLDVSQLLFEDSIYYIDMDMTAIHQLNLTDGSVSTMPLLNQRKPQKHGGALVGKSEALPEFIGADGTLFFANDNVLYAICPHHLRVRTKFTIGEDNHINFLHWNDKDGTLIFSDRRGNVVALLPPQHD